MLVIISVEDNGEKARAPTFRFLNDTTGPKSLRTRNISLLSLMLRVRGKTFTCTARLARDLEAVPADCKVDMILTLRRSRNGLLDPEYATMLEATSSYVKFAECSKFCTAVFSSDNILSLVQLFTLLG